MQNETSTPKILILDDSVDILDSYLFLLELEGYQIKSTTSTKEAFDMLMNDDYSLLMLDYYMPEMNAPDVIRHIRGFSDVVILLQTGFAGQLPAKDILNELDIQLYYNKTSDIEILLSLVAAGIKISQVLKQNKNIINNLDKLVHEKNRELIEANMKLEAMLDIDGLTGAYNKRFMSRIIDLEQRKADRQNYIADDHDNSFNNFSVIMLDIDYFKNYNDKNGHLEGDLLLKQIVEIIKNCIRKTDMVCRFGGEEFVVILPQTQREGSIFLAEKIRKMIEGYPFSNRDSQPNGKLTVSLGLGFYPEDKEVLEVADKRLYKAKHNGRNTVVFS